MATKSKKERQVVFEKEQPSVPDSDDFSESKPSAIENVISVALGLAVVFVIGAMIVNVIRNRNNPQTNTPETQTVQENSATASASYTVEAGDTLWSIAEKFYKDGFKYTEIEKANNMNENSHLEKGMKIVIPEVAGISTSVQGTTGPSGVAMAPSTTSAPSTSPVASSTPVPTNTPAPSSTPVPSVTPVPTVLTQGPTGATGTQGSETMQQGQTSSASTDKQYTVVQGDSLWSISVKRYGNGYRWTEIAKMNNLKNPGLIHPGNVFLMP